ncbi:toll/interleukin-1 receptor domain-containing protein [Streptomyces rimosus]|uniref:toll/interleukin-1 receptor domain-containing protein n=1 Tax=Streptomyces rimosus TaxID=1927 RepID=UPI00067D46CC|nr:toll/interleukin-1 receptor domain-containing protein [Streptomyces rimosus]
MHEIFVNYRTGDGKESAQRLAEALNERFGGNSTFLAERSIPPGSKFSQVMLGAVRRSCVLLVLIGERWLDAPDRQQPERRALDNEDDWVRREIEEALDCGVLVVPLLLGRRVEQLDPKSLPPSLAELAECQYERLWWRDGRTDVARLGDRLVAQVAELASLDTAKPSAERARQGSRHEPDPSVRNEGQRGGIGAVRGTVGTFVNESNAPMHTGTGDQIGTGGTKINGDGTTQVSGDHAHVPISHRFGSSPRYRDGER